MKGLPFGRNLWREEMKVRAKIIGISQPIPGFERQKEISVKFTGDSLMDLLLHISSGMRSEVRELFIDEQGGVSANLSVNINGIAVTDSNRGNLGLKKGDLVELISSPG